MVLKENIFLMQNNIIIKVFNYFRMKCVPERFLRDLK